MWRRQLHARSMGNEAYEQADEANLDSEAAVTSPPRGVSAPSELSLRLAQLALLLLGEI